MSKVKYHINPNTGRPNQCHATVRDCKYAVNGELPEHYETKEEAKQAAEKLMNNKHGVTNTLTKTYQRKNDNLINDSDLIMENSVEYNIRVSSLSEAQEYIDKLNRKLERAGIEERFTMKEEKYLSTIVDDDGIEHKIEKVRLFVNYPKISYQGYSFLASVGQEEGGLIVRSPEEVDLGGWRPDTMWCDHCGKIRRRNKTYLVEGPDGARKQIGSSCLPLYLGVKPNGLWALDKSPLEDFENEENTRSYHPSSDYVEPTRDILAIALAVSDNGKNFVSRKYEYISGVPSTATSVENILYGRLSSHEDIEWRDKIMAKAEQIKNSHRINDMLKTIQETNDDNDYVNNMKVLAGSENVTPQSRNLLISAIAMENNINNKKGMLAGDKEYRESFTKGYMGDVGEKLKNKALTVVSNDEVDGSDYFGNNITRSKLVLKDEDGHQAILWASRIIHAKPEQELIMSSGTIKNHTTYRDVDQTVLTRARFKNELTPEEYHHHE